MKFSFLGNFQFFGKFFTESNLKARHSNTTFLKTRLPKCVKETRTLIKAVVEAIIKVISVKHYRVRVFDKARVNLSLILVSFWVWRIEERNLKMGFKSATRSFRRNVQEEKGPARYTILLQYLTEILKELITWKVPLNDLEDCWEASF